MQCSKYKTFTKVLLLPILFRRSLRLDSLLTKCFDFNF